MRRRKKGGNDKTLKDRMQSGNAEVQKVEGHAAKDHNKSELPGVE